MWWGDSLTAYFFCVCLSSFLFLFSLNQILLSKAFIFVEFCIGPCARHSKRDNRRLYNSLGCQKYYHGEQESLQHMWLLGGIPRAFGSAIYMVDIDASWAPRAGVLRWTDETSQTNHNRRWIQYYESRKEQEAMQTRVFASTDTSVRLTPLLVPKGFVRTHKGCHCRRGSYSILTARVPASPLTSMS